MRLRKGVISLVVMAIVGTMVVFNYNDVKADAPVYTVHRINDNGTFGVAIISTGDFNTALNQMNAAAATKMNVVVLSSTSRSPLKIVAADRALVQSYPYRRGNRTGVAGGNTMHIYGTSAMNSALTYIPAHYSMAYYGTYIANGQLYLDVEIQGARGFVDLDKTDIIPLLFVEKEIPINLGGNEDYYNPGEAVYSMVIKPDSYTVKYNSNYAVNEITVNVNRTYPFNSEPRTSSTTYAVAPTWLTPGVTYYSPDGITFYTDYALTNKVSEEKFYAYFQWLPLRSMTKHTATSMNNLLKSYGYQGNSALSKYSIMVGNEQHFINQGLNYGMNPILVFAQASLESGYGTSGYAKNRNNLFGYGAADSNPDAAHYYANIGEGIKVHMSTQLAEYMMPGNWKHYGFSFGNKGSGITVKYASDPYYGIKVASLAYQIDRNNGFIDYNAYKLVSLNDNTSYGVYKAASLSNGTWYSTEGGLKNQIISGIETVGAFTKTNLAFPIYNGKISYDAIPVILSQEFGYVNNSNTTPVKQFGPTSSVPTPPAGWTPPSKEITTSTTPELATVNTTGNVALNLRDDWNTNSNILTTIPFGTKITVYRTSNGWAKVTYNGYTGYVFVDLLKFEVVIPPEVTISNKPETAYVNTVANGDLNLRVSWSTDSNVLAAIPYGTKLTVYRTSNGWAQTTYNGKTGFVSADLLRFVEEVTVSPTAESAETLDSLRLRKSWTTDSEEILMIPKGTKLTVYRTSNGWAQTTYNGKTGYVSADFLKFETQPPVGLKGDVNGDGKVTSLDYMIIKNYIMGSRTLTESEKKNADVNGDNKVSSLDYMIIKNLIMNN